VNLYFAAAVIVGVTAVVLTMVFFLRRIFPVGGIFTDSDRAAGIFGVLGTSFAVLLAFVIFLSFETFGNAKQAASVEAVAVQELYRDAQRSRPRSANSSRANSSATPVRSSTTDGGRCESSSARAVSSTSGCSAWR
jgi:hypothetical protein